MPPIKLTLPLARPCGTQFAMNAVLLDYLIHLVKYSLKLSFNEAVLDASVLSIADIVRRSSIPLPSNTVHTK